MRRNILFIIASLTILVGCTKNNEEYADWIQIGILTWGYRLITAENLSDRLYIHIDPIFISNDTSERVSQDFWFDICPQFDSKAYRPRYVANSKEYTAYHNWENALYNNGLVNECSGECEHYQEHHYVYAGIADGAKIYADRVLWGREPGEDLGDMFVVPSYSDNLIVAYPEFNLLYGWDEPHPETFRELMQQRMALPKNVVARLAFAELPPEDLDVVTFTVEIPVDVDYYEDYSPEMYELHPTLKPEGRRLLKGSVTVEFVPAD